MIKEQRDKERRAKQKRYAIVALSISLVVVLAIVVLNLINNVIIPNIEIYIKYTPSTNKLFMSTFHKNDGNGEMLNFSGKCNPYFGNMPLF